MLPFTDKPVLRDTPVAVRRAADSGGAALVVGTTGKPIVVGYNESDMPVGRLIMRPVQMAGVAGRSGADGLLRAPTGGFGLHYGCRSWLHDDPAGWQHRAP
ncbi:MAG: hypothetical protein ACLSVD_08040 [Eggerthellaceae bacterium]